MQKDDQRKIAVLMNFVFVLPVFLCFYYTSCLPNAKSSQPGSTQHFSKIYDTGDTYDYNALAIKQTGSGGYIILGEVEVEAGWHPYLLQVDAAGEFLWATDPEAFDDYINPIPGLLIYNEHYYFFCNKISGTDSILTLLKCSKNNGECEPVPLHDDLFLVKNAAVNDRNRTIIPMHASKIPDDKILLLAFDAPTDRILVRIMDFRGERILENKHDDQFKDTCQEDYPIRDKRLHFTGLNNSGNNFYYFQSFSRNQMYNDYNVCFRFTKIDPATWEYMGNPFPIQKPLIAMKWHSSEKFSAARVDNDLVCYFVNSDLNDLKGLDDVKRKGHPQYESNETKPVFIETVTIDDREVVFFAGSTKTSRIVLAVFDLSTGVNLDCYYIGNIYPYAAAGLTGTHDGGLAVLGTTFYIYRISRICLFKLSKTDLENIVR